MQCSAHSKQTKNRCRNGSIPGGSVCRFHGGGIPAVKAKADLRVREALEAMLPKGLTRYNKLLGSKNESVALGATKDLLDRTGHKPIEQRQDLPYDPVEVEALDNLTDEELVSYIELRRKITKPGSSTGTATASESKPN